MKGRPGKGGERRPQWDGDDRREQSAAVAWKPGRLGADRRTRGGGEAGDGGSSGRPRELGDGAAQESGCRGSGGREEKENCGKTVGMGILAAGT